MLANQVYQHYFYLKPFKISFGFFLAKFTSGIIAPIAAIKTLIPNISNTAPKLLLIKLNLINVEPLTKLFAISEAISVINNVTINERKNI